MSDAAEIKKLAEDMGKNWEEFKKTNDERLKLIENDKGNAEQKEKLEKMDKSIIEGEKKYEALKLVVNRPGASDDPKEAKEKQKVEAKKAMNEYLRTRNMSEEGKKAYLAEFDEKYQDIEEFKTLSVDSQPDGGYWVRPEISTRITEKVFESSPIRQVSDVMTIGTDAFEEVYDDDEPDSGWVGEQQDRDDTDNSQVNKIRIETHELFAQPKATQKLLEDSSIDVEAWHMGKVTRKFARDEATAFVTGDGVLRPRGLLSYEAGDGFNKLEQVNSGDANLVTSDGLVLLQNTLIEEFQAGASWMMKRATATAIRQLKDDDGRYMFSIDGRLSEARLFTLLGKEVRYADDLPDVAANSLSILYGDFKEGYLIIDRLGISVLRDPFTSKGFIKFYTRKRVGGAVRHFQAIKIGKTAA